MIVFVDTNVLLDVFQQRSPYYESSAFVWGVAEKQKAKVYISAISYNNIFYIIRKHSGKDAAQHAIEVLNATFSLAPLDQMTLGKAIWARKTDFEDAIQFYSAISIGAECIVTRNLKDFPQDVLPVLTPDTFYSLFVDEFYADLLKE